MSAEAIQFRFFQMLQRTKIRVLRNNVIITKFPPVNNIKPKVSNFQFSVVSKAFKSVNSKSTRTILCNSAYEFGNSRSNALSLEYNLRKPYQKRFTKLIRLFVTGAFTLGYLVITSKKAACRKDELALGKFESIFVIH